jgi:superfamily I DNA and/or RNA helicase
MDILSNDMPRNVEAKEVETAWNTLFFVVPVVSTTFSSPDRIFWNMGKESIGRLLIDEDGQATPQAAVGAIYRVKRTVVVGDPL